MGSTGLQISAGKASAGIFQACVAVVALACAPGARAGSFAYGADVGVGVSDNITETSVDKRTDELAAVGVQFTGQEQTSRLQAGMTGDLQYLDFIQNTYSPEVIGNFNGIASYVLIPEHFRWTLQDSFGQGLVDPFAAATPGNRENINTVTTGPTLTFPLALQTLLSVTGDFSHVTYQVSPLDNNEYGGGISLTHLLSELSRLSLSVESTRYDFQDAINPDYNQQEAYLRYEVAGVRTKLSADAGYQQLKGSQLDSGGFLGRLSVTRTLAPESILTFTAGHADSNSGAFLTQMQSVNGIGLDTTPGRQSSSPFTNEYVTAGWRFTRRRTTLDVGASRYKQVYPDQPILNESTTGGDVRVTRVLYPTWTAGAYVDYSKQTFDAQTGGSYRQLHTGAEMKWRLGRLFGLSLQYDHYNRDTNLALYSAAEDRLWLRLEYGDQAALAAARLTPTANGPDSALSEPYKLQSLGH